MAILCVSKYRSILEAVGRDLTEEAPPTTADEGRGAGEGTQISNEGGRPGSSPAVGEEGASVSQNQERESEKIHEPVDGDTEKAPKEKTLKKEEEEEEKENPEDREGGIERPMSVETDTTATPDLERTFHFPVGGEGAAAAGSVAGPAVKEEEEEGEGGAVPASVVFYQQSMDTSEQIRAALRKVGPFLCTVLVGQRSGLGKMLVGSDGRPLLNDGGLRRRRKRICYTCM